ncbi:MAG: hypothetical protein ACTSRK_16550 [Promethearchaeota archaeon]
MPRMNSGTAKAKKCITIYLLLLYILFGTVMIFGQIQQTRIESRLNSYQIFSQEGITSFYGKNFSLQADRVYTFYFEFEGGLSYVKVELYDTNFEGDPLLEIERSKILLPRSNSGVSISSRQMIISWTSTENMSLFLYIQNSYGQGSYDNTASLTVYTDAPSIYLDSVPFLEDLFMIGLTGLIMGLLPWFILGLDFISKRSEEKHLNHPHHPEINVYENKVWKDQTEEISFPLPPDYEKYYPLFVFIPALEIFLIPILALTRSYTTTIIPVLYWVIFGLFMFNFVLGIAKAQRDKSRNEEIRAIYSPSQIE